MWLRIPKLFLQILSITNHILATLHQCKPNLDPVNSFVNNYNDEKVIQNGVDFFVKSRMCQTVARVGI